MLVKHIVELTRGDVRGAFTIEKFSNITASLSKIKKGALFLANDEISIKDAINLGAYGILCDFEPQILDSETIYIKVQNSRDSFLRIAGYMILSKSIRIFSLSDIELDIFAQICRDRSVFVFDNNIGNLIDVLQRDELCWVATNEPALLGSAISVTPSVVPMILPFKIYDTKLFDVQIELNSMVYPLQLMPLFIGELASVVYICQNYHLAYELDGFRQLSNHAPIFVDYELGVVGYGKGAKALMAEDSLEELKSLGSYISESASWGELVIFLAKDSDIKNQDLDFKFSEIFIYESHGELYRAMKSMHFNFGIIFGMNRAELIKVLDDYKEIPPTLFDD